MAWIGLTGLIGLAGLAGLAGLTGLTGLNLVLVVRFGFVCCFSEKIEYVLVACALIAESGFVNWYVLHWGALCLLDVFALKQHLLAWPC